MARVTETITNEIVQQDHVARAMANRISPATGSWLMAEELLENGDPAFVDELCRIHEPNQLGSFAAQWYRDRRPASRRMLALYLSRPLATYRHEPLVKRLFKLAETAGDDEVMGWFMLALDRTIRRVKVKRRRYDWNNNSQWTEEYLKTPGHTVMPRHDNQPRRRWQPNSSAPTSNPYAHDTSKRLFSIATRCYLRRRVWRYFRNLGKQDPNRYVKGISSVLVRYTDEDCVNGLAVLDNWSLVHALFHHCDAIVARPSGWRLADGKGLSDLKPGPAFEEVWKSSDAPLLAMIGQAQSRTVRQWAILWTKEHHPGLMSAVPLETLLQWLASDDPELAELAIQTLKSSVDKSQVSVQQWLQLIDASNPEILDRVCELIAEQCSPAGLTLADQVRLACARPVPVAKLGLEWLRAINRQSSNGLSASDREELLRVTEAECVAVRPELVALVIEWLRTDVLHASDSSDSQDAGTRAAGVREAVMRFVDSRHADVRELGWAWLVDDESLRGDVGLWQQLLETPYDDVRLRVIELLNRHTASGQGDVNSLAKLSTKLDTNLLRLMWASVLLNIHRGGRRKPEIVATMTRRLQHHPEETEELLPILAVALRSVRSVEFRAGLSGIVHLIQTRPEVVPLVKQHFPELVLT